VLFRSKVRLARARSRPAHIDRGDCAFGLAQHDRAARPRLKVVRVADSYAANVCDRAFARAASAALLTTYFFHSGRMLSNRGSLFYYGE
jgi:hypothetical protein